MYCIIKWANKHLYLTCVLSEKGASNVIDFQDQRVFCCNSGIIHSQIAAVQSRQNESVGLIFRSLQSFGPQGFCLSPQPKACTSHLQHGVFKPHSQPRQLAETLSLTLPRGQVCQCETTPLAISQTPLTSSPSPLTTDLSALRRTATAQA